MIRIGAFTKGESGKSRHARSFAARLAELEPTELLDWEDVKPPGKAFWRRWDAEWRNSAGIAMGDAARVESLDARYRIAYYSGETTRIQPSVRAALEDAAMVWTPSNWGRGVLIGSGIPGSRVRVVPAGVDPAIFHPAEEKRRHDGVFRFLCVGKWGERKGTADLVRAFRGEFAPGEAAELVLHCGPAEATAEAAGRALNGASLDLWPRIVCNPPATLDGLVQLMQGCDAFVLPTRGEGWGHAILEAMACGLPCIVTGHSGLTEFAHEGTCYFIRVAAMIPVQDPASGDPVGDRGEWAQPDTEHLRELMRFVFKRRELAQVTASGALDEAVSLWTWKRAAAQAMSCIRELRGAPTG